MKEIALELNLRTDPNRVYNALTTPEGLSGWWTKASGKSHVGAVLEFNFGGFVSKMKVIELEANKRVLWETVESLPDWVGTKISFLIERNPSDNAKVVLTFKHSGFENSNDDTAAYAMNWAVFLLSLRKFTETGTGRPFPDHYNA